MSEETVSLPMHLYVCVPMYLYRYVYALALTVPQTAALFVCMK